MRYRLVCFDAGFTLLSPRETLADALAEVLAEHGHATDEAAIHRAWEAANRWFWEEYGRPDNRTWVDDELIDQTWRDYHGVLLRELGVEVTSELVERILAGQRSPDTWQPFDDVEPMLSALDAHRRRDGLTVGVVSDWGSTLREIFRALGLDRYVDFVLASAEVRLAKPDPALYRLALHRAGVAPGEAIMIGDSYRVDVAAPRSIGMDAVLLDRGGEAGPEVEGPVIRSLAELPPILEAGTRVGPVASVTDAERAG